MPISVQTNHLKPTTIHHQFEADGTPISVQAGLTALRDDPTVRDQLIDVLGAAPFRAFFWEMPPVTDATADRPFEFVLVDSPALARVRPDRAPFSAKFDGASPVAVFESLGGDARLIAPQPLGEESAYPYLAAFVRAAPPAQVDALWRVVAEEMLVAIGPEPRWLSTSGLGVSWLHVRIDQRPKYYVHAPYRAVGAP